MTRVLDHAGNYMHMLDIAGINADLLCVLLCLAGIWRMFEDVGIMHNTHTTHTKQGTTANMREDKHHAGERGLRDKGQCAENEQHIIYKV